MSGADAAEGVGPAALGPAPERAMRALMGYFPTGVTVVTARRADGGPTGTTVNAVSSVSLRPPLLLVCLADDSETLAAIRRSTYFALNFLAADQRHHSRRFAAKGDAARPEEVSYHEHPTGVPTLPDSLATAICRVEAIHRAGDHDIVVGEPVATATAEDTARPLLFYRGSYLELGRELV